MTGSECRLVPPPPSLTFEDGIVKLPDLRRVDGVLYRSEIVGVHAAHQPAPARQTRDVRRTLKQAAQVALCLTASRAAVPGGNGTGTVQHGAVTASGDGQANVWQRGRVAGGILEVGIAVEVGDGNALQELADGGDGFVSALGEPFPLLGRQAAAVSHFRAARGTVDGRRRIALGRLIGGALDEGRLADDDDVGRTRGIVLAREIWCKKGNGVSNM